MTRVRTLVACAVASAVAVRVSGAQTVSGAYARVAADPGASLRDAADGWTVAGTLGDATAQGMRELPLAAWFWLSDVVGLPAAAGRTGWCVLVVVLAVVGGLRLGRARSTSRGGPGSFGADDEPWTPWIGSLLYACGPVLVATVLHAPGDGLVVALLPWVLVPLALREVGWRPAATSAAWLGLAGAGSAPWAFAALVAGAVAAAATTGRPGGAGQLLRWSLLALTASAWWIVAYAWEAVHATAVTALAASAPAGSVLGDALGVPATAWLVVVLAPAAVAVGALATRAGADRMLVGALLGAAVVGAVVGALVGRWPAWLPVPASAATATDAVPVPWIPLVAWVALAGLVAWTPLVDHVRAQAYDGSDRRWSQRSGAALAALAGLALASAVGPVLVAQERPTADETTDRAQWARVAEWSATAPPGRVLVLPAVPDGRVDAVVADALSGRPWVARDTFPLSDPAATAALDDVVGRLARGHDGAGTAAALRHLGVSYVLLRNDLDAATDRARPLGLVRHALSRQGASRVAVVEAEGTAQEAADTVDLGLRDPAGSLEIWAVDRAADGTVHPGAPMSVAGDAGVVGDLADAGLEPTGAIVLGPAADGTRDLVSDSARRRDVDHRVANDPFGVVVGSDQPWTAVPPDAAQVPTASRMLSGGRDIRASSSAVDLDGAQRRLGAGPSAAADGNAFTAWQSRRGAVVGEWWEIVLDAPVDLSTGSLQVVQNPFAPDSVSRVRLESDSGTREVDVPADGLVVLTDVGPTERLRVVATEVTGTPSGTSSFGIVELTAPGLEVREELAVDGGDTDTWVLSARPGSHATCVPSYPVGGTEDPLASETVCSRAVSLEGPDPIRLGRVIDVGSATDVAGRVWVRAADSMASRRTADGLARPSITATGSSVASSDLVADPQAAVDADPATAWRPAPEDEQPTLELSWRRRSLVSGLRVVAADPELVPQPSRVVVQHDGSSNPVTATIADDGVVVLPPVRTRSLSVTFVADAPSTTLDSATGGVLPVPVAVSEVEVVGGPRTRYDADAIEQLPCGSGPTVTVDGKDHRTAVQVSARQVVQASVVVATLCEGFNLRAGEVPVAVEASFSWIPLGLVLSPPDGPLGDVGEPVLGDDVPSAVPVGLIDPAPSETTLDVDGPSTLVLAVPAGAGWTAAADGRDLPSLTVDGWSQAWSVPDGTARVSLRYSSADELRLGAGAGLLGWVAVLLVALGFLPRTRRPRTSGPEERRDHAMTGRSTQA